MKMVSDMHTVVCCIADSEEVTSKERREKRGKVMMVIIHANKRQFCKEINAWRSFVPQSWGSVLSLVLSPVLRSLLSLTLRTTGSVERKRKKHTMQSCWRNVWEEEKKQLGALTHINKHTHIPPMSKREGRKYTTNKKNRDREEALTDDDEEKRRRRWNTSWSPVRPFFSLLVFDCFASVSDWITVTSSPSLACALKGREVRGREEEEVKRMLSSVRCMWVTEASQWEANIISKEERCKMREIKTWDQLTHITQHYMIKGRSELREGLNNNITLTIWASRREGRDEMCLNMHWLRSDDEKEKDRNESLTRRKKKSPGKRLQWEN